MERSKGETANFSVNVRQLRRRLKMSQKAFIVAYLSGGDNTPMISVPTLSNLENGGASNIAPLAQALANRMGLDEDVLFLPSQDFSQAVEQFVQSSKLEPDGNFFQDTPKPGTVEALVKMLSDYLMDAMIGGELKPGDKLPSDRALSETFGVSRSALREAVKVLSALGLVTVLPAQGTFVASKPTDFFLLPLAWSFFLGDSNSSNIVQVRNALENESARLAAKNATQEARGELEAVFARQTAAYEKVDFRQFLDLDMDFHQTIAKCSGNPIIYSMLHTSRKLLAHISGSGMATREHLDTIYAEHKAICEAILCRDDALAGERMAIHMKNARKRYRT